MTRLYAPLFLAALALATLCGHPACAQKGGATPAYTFTDLGGLPGLTYQESHAWAINDTGQIAGDSETQGATTTLRHPVIWHRDASGNTVITDLLFGGHAWPVDLFGEAGSINSQGEVVGLWSDGGPTTHSFLLRPDRSTGSPVWYVDRGDGFNKLLIDLGEVFLRSINDSTQIVADASVIRVDASGNEVVTDLPGPGNAINNNGQVAALFGAEPVIWQLDAGGNVVTTTTLTPLPGYPHGEATCINGQGQAAGDSISTPNSMGIPYVHATLWQNGAAPTDLAVKTKNSSSGAGGINTVSGVVQVVGYVSQGSYGAYAFLWKNGVLADLNTLASASGMTLTSAEGINANGQIVGSGNVTSKSHYTHAFVLTPR